MGKGLSALLNDSVNVLPNKNEIVSGSEASSMGSVNEIKISEIEVNPLQPRTDFEHNALAELSDSIK